MAVLGTVMVGVTYMIKTYTPVKSNYLPFISVGLGGIIGASFALMYGLPLADYFIAGLISGGLAVTGNQMFKQIKKG